RPGAACTAGGGLPSVSAMTEGAAGVAAAAATLSGFAQAASAHAATPASSEKCEGMARILQVGRVRWEDAFASGRAGNPHARESRTRRCRALHGRELARLA